MQRAKFGIIVIFFAFLNISCATLGNDAVLYKDAQDNARLDKLDFTFLDLKELISTYPNSYYIQAAKLSLAEYYFNTGNYREAIDTLLNYIANYPTDKNIIFAEGFLYKILMSKNIETGPKNAEFYDKLRKHFFSKPIFLMFSSSKTKTFTSAFNNHYCVQEYIDKIEIFKNDEPFLQVLP